MAKKSEGKKFKRIRVTMTVDYAIPVHGNSKYTEINGWTMEEVIENWFKKYPLSQYHASRDGHKIGGTEKVLSIQVQRERRKLIIC